MEIIRYVDKYMYDGFMSKNCDIEMLIKFSVESQYNQVIGEPKDIPIKIIIPDKEVKK